MASSVICPTRRRRISWHSRERQQKGQDWCAQLVIVAACSRSGSTGWFCLQRNLEFEEEPFQKAHAEDFLSCYLTQQQRIDLLSKFCPQSAAALTEPQELINACIAKAGGPYRLLKRVDKAELARYYKEYYSGPDNVSAVEERRYFIVRKWQEVGFLSAAFVHERGTTHNVQHLWIAVLCQAFNAKPASEVAQQEANMRVRSVTQVVFALLGGCFTSCPVRNAAGAQGSPRGGLSSQGWCTLAA